MLEYLAPDVWIENVSCGPPPIAPLNTESVDRLHNLAQAIHEGTRWVAFEPNRASTWGALRRQIADFLFDVWRSGTLVGSSEAEAFFIVCDRSTMTQDDIDSGTLVCVVGVALTEPAEFVVFRVMQKSLESLS